MPVPPVKPEKYAQKRKFSTLGKNAFALVDKWGDFLAKEAFVSSFCESVLC